MNINLTIFTPTFNRGYILKSCYESLCKQTCSNFEWLIIDDGSIDNTEELVSKWMSEKRIQIRYFKQLNGGKHRAHNKAIKIAKGDLFLCLDSDDLLVNNAVERILNIWCKLNNTSYVGLIALKAFKNGEIIGTKIPDNIKAVSMFDLYHKHNFRGDCLPIFITSILKEYLYPEIDGETFVTEALVYNRISSMYNMFLVNEVLYKCEYLQDGYTKNILKTIKNNPKGYILYYSELMNMKCKLKIRFKAAVNYIALKYLINDNGMIRNSPNKLLTTSALPFGYLLCYLRYIK